MRKSPRIIPLAATLLAAACSSAAPPIARYSITDSKSYEASLFRQNCSICHGREADGQTLDDGRQIPSLRRKPYKYATEDQIYRHIAEGGNGMVPFRDILTQTEIKQLVEFVRHDLRGGE